jgi:hypothetical protein
MRTATPNRSLLIVVVGVLVVVAAGAALASAIDDPDTPVSSGPITGAPPPGGGGPMVVEPRPGMVDVYARPFDRARVGDDDMTATIDFVGGVEPCSVLDRVDVRYGTETVTITLYEGRDPDAGDVACIEIGVLKQVVVHLDEPLDGREIVDGAA